MCLLHNTVKENQLANTVVGQIVIDDPDHPHVSCAGMSIGQTLPATFNYSCLVAQGNDEFGSLVSKMFTVDSSLVLKTTTPLNYELFALFNGTVRVHVTCKDPPHVIRQSFVVHITGRTSIYLLLSSLDLFQLIFKF